MSRSFCLAFFLAINFIRAGALHAQEVQFPVVRDFGGVYPIPEASEFPRSDILYKVIVDLKSGSATTDATNPALYNLARLMNLHGIGGVDKENMKVLAVVHGEATMAVLSDEAYKNRFGRENPNSELLKALQEAGVKLFICGQSLHARKVRPEELAEGINISLSALTMLTTYQLEGYALISL